MRNVFFILLLAIAGVLLTSTVVLADELKTVTLSVDNMTCSMCPITVKKRCEKSMG